MRTPLVVSLGLLAIVLAGAAAGLASCNAKKSGASLAVDPDPLEFGRHRYGERVEKTIRLVNTTSHPVAFRDPKFDCGCFFLLSPPPKMRLDAGESVSFVVLMDSTHAFPGRFHKTMTVVVDDPAHEVVDFPVLGEVYDFRTIEPHEVAFGLVAAAGPPVEKRVTVRAGNGWSVGVSNAKSGDEKRFSVSIEKMNDGADLVLKTLKGATPGRFQAQVMFDVDVGPTSGGERHTYPETIWVNGEVR